MIFVGDFNAWYGGEKKNGGTGRFTEWLSELKLERVKPKHDDYTCRTRNGGQSRTDHVVVSNETVSGMMVKVEVKWKRANTVHAAMRVTLSWPKAEEGKQGTHPAKRLKVWTEMNEEEWERYKKETEEVAKEMRKTLKYTHTHSLTFHHHLFFRT